MNVLALIAFILVEIIFAAFIFVIARSGLKDRTNRSFFYFLIAFALWGAANYVSNLTFLPIDQLLLLNRALFAVSIFGLLALLIFITHTTHQRPGRWSSVLTTGAVATGVGISFTSWVVPVVFVERAGIVGVEFGLLSLLYFLIVVYLSGLLLYRLAKGVRQKSSPDRSRARVLFVSIGIAIASILISNVLLPVGWNNFSLTMVGLLAGMFIIVGVSYGIVRHGMFDIKYAAVRSVTYSLVLLTLAIGYFALATLLSGLFGNVFVSSQQAISGVIISLSLALVFQPVKRFFDRITNTIFYKNEYSTDDFFAQLNRTAVSTTDLKSLMRRITKHIASTLKSEQAFFLIQTDDGRHVSGGTEHYAKLPAADVRLLSAHFEESNDILQTSLLESRDPLRRLLLSHRIELTMPLFRGKEVFGFLCLGDHLTSVYTRRDLRALKTASDELVIAIQNALSIQEVKELNAHLEQRISTATKELRASNAQLQRLDEAKDEFISMASHQLRTPLTSIKGYISMLIEGDVGKISPQQKHLLNEAFISSERMVRLIGDFLNVSRLQTGKFIIEKRPVDLAKLVAQELESLGPNASARGLSFTYKRPKKFPIVDVDENKIQQVIMNFADNAIYYSKEKSKITVKLSATKDRVEFTVKDTGIGVPQAEQDNLFNKFFRATNARKQRPDGTGVGLFLAKKVIDDHNGKIIFESKEGKGSTFGFSIPLTKSKS